MRMRLFPGAALLGLAALAAAAGAAPAAEKAAKPGKPTLVVRVNPLETLIEDFRFLAAQAGKEEEAKQFEGVLKARTGDQGLDGLDVKKPIGLYGTLAAELPKSEAVLLLPVADEKAFLAMLERLDLKAEEGKDGVYTVNLPNVPVPGYFRFADGYAYATFRDPAAIAKDRLLKPAAFLAFQGAPPAASLTVNLDTVPESVKDFILSQAANGFAEAKQKGKPGENEAEKAGREAAVDFFAERFKALVNEGGQVALRVKVDRKAGELTAGVSVAGKSGSKMAADIAGLAAAPSVAAGLGGKDAAVSLLGHLTLPDQLRKPLVDAAEKGAREGLEKEKDEAKRQIAKSVIDALMPTLRAGELDGGVALRGPDAKGLYTLLLAGRVREGKGLEKALREAMEKAPADARAKIKLDVARAGDATIHRIEPDKVDDQTRAMLGDGPFFVAVRDDALFVTAGADAEAALKAVAAAGPGPAPLVDVKVSAARIAKFMAKDNPQAPEIAREVFAKNPDGDRLSLTVEGGKALRLRLTMKTALLGFFAKLDEAKKR